MVQWEVNTIGTARGPLRQNNNVGMLLVFITMREPGGQAREIKGRSMLTCDGSLHRRRPATATAALQPMRFEGDHVTHLHPQTCQACLRRL